EHIVVEDGDSCLRLHTAVVVEGGGGPEDVVGLPFAGFAAGVDQWRRLFVDAGGLAVDVGGVVVGVHDLEFVAGVAGAGGGEEDAGVAARLGFAGDVFGNLVFEVELVVAKAFFGFDVAGLFVDGQDAVVDAPL